MKRLKHIFIIIFLIGITLKLYSQNIVVNDRCKNAYSEIISLRFDDAKVLIDNEKKVNPDNLYPQYLEFYIDFLKAFISEDEDVYEQLEDSKDNVIKKLESLPDNNPYKRYLIGNVRLQYAMAGTKFGDYFSSALDIRRSFLLLKKNIQQFPGFKLQYATMGVLHILIGMIPDKYNWILKLISLEGTVEQGMGELYQVLELCNTNEEYAYLKPGVLFYVAFTEMNLGLDKSKKKQLLKELESYSNDNLLLGFLRANMLMRMGKNDKAEELLLRLNSLKGYYPFYYLHYLEGETKLRKLDLDAKIQYQYFIDNFKGKNYLKDAQRKIAWSYLIEFDTAGYLKNIEKVKNTGDDFVGIDREAEKEAESNKIPNVELLKSRLLFDGGYYTKSEKILKTLNTENLNEDEKLEVLYRLGRINQKIDNFDKAVEFFKETINKGSDSKRYFAGNAALQLGKMYENKKQYKEALYYYKLCRSLDFNEYETSIKEKAKQGVDRVENMI